MSKPKLLVLVTAGCLLIILCCLCSCVLSVLGFQEVYREEQNLSVEFVCEEAVVDQEFNCELILSNSGDSLLTVTSMDFADELLEDVEIVSASPSFIEIDSFTAFKTSYTDLTFAPIRIKPGTSETVTFRFIALDKSRSWGPVTVYTDVLYHQKEIYTSIVIDR